VQPMVEQRRHGISHRQRNAQRLLTRIAPIFDIGANMECRRQYIVVESYVRIGQSARVDALARARRPDRLIDAYGSTVR
jgi:hypothetical protein